MIARLPTLDRREFSAGFVSKNTPVILTRQMDDWGARSWTPQSLKDRVPSVVLPAQEGNMEQDATIGAAASSNGTVRREIRNRGGQ